jgi:hypothetical protein
MDTTAERSSRTSGLSFDSRSPRTNKAAPSIDTTVRGFSIGSSAAGSFAFSCGSSAIASASRRGPRRNGLLTRVARNRFFADATSLRPSSLRIAHAHA